MTKGQEYFSTFYNVQNNPKMSYPALLGGWSMPTVPTICQWEAKAGELPDPMGLRPSQNRKKGGEEGEELSNSKCQKKH